MVFIVRTGSPADIVPSGSFIFRKKVVETRADFLKRLQFYRESLPFREIITEIA